MDIFHRIEQKYVLNKNEYEKMIKELNKYTIHDKYYESSICSVYFDDDNYDLIINSIDSPLYKEKVRLRSYGVIDDNGKVFLELKKKYKGVTYKKRVTMTLNEFWNYYEKSIIPKSCDNLSMKEIDYCFNKYRLKPKMFISYDRYSYLDKENNNIRITFDYNIKYRDKHLNLDSNKYLEDIIEDDIYIMEIKTRDSIPIWFTKILSNLKLYPSGYSKYKEAYLRTLKV
jgi:SPX domain protein involved in polyphosphate accumulation